MPDEIKYFLDWYKLTIFLASSAMNCIYEFHLKSGVFVIAFDAENVLLLAIQKFEMKKKNKF